ncbi:NAD(P)-dependent oxidoreductase [Pseudonocardia spinosispora]|uniref:NAD(P)-dependent oxidoreductase n=1 Tax=Pseudonocardia spinosispora TaxID=103441 RepID=UPI001B7F87E9|nr:NAD(P)-dependent oxidoreductase [Pseudonocardia spinosispora]
MTPRSLTQAGLENVAELQPLRAAGFELVSGPVGRQPSADELRDLLPGCVGWLAGVEQITAEVLDRADELEVISRNGTGTDAIDLDTALRRGIRVERTPGANARGVAELALALALALLREVPRSAHALKHGGWQRWQGRELADCRVGVVGLGAIGSKVAELFTTLGAQVVGHDPYPPENPPVPLRELTDLLATSDVISLHAPPPPDGKPLLDETKLALLPPGALVINTARAGLVDEAAILDALDTAKLGGYAVDAFETEPPEPSALLRHDRVLATPHIGGYTGASVRRATEQAVANLLAVLDGAR